MSSFYKTNKGPVKRWADLPQLVKTAEPFRRSIIAQLELSPAQQQRFEMLFGRLILEIAEQYRPAAS